MSETRDFTIRRSLAEDADGIAAVHIQAWREAYAELLSARALETLDLEERKAQWRRIVAAGEPESWAAVDDGAVIGWANASNGRDEERPRERELEGLYILASHYGSGVGQALLEAAIGEEPAYLWVAAGNPRAQAFYRRNGFAFDGAHTSHPLQGEPIEIVRMVR